MLKSIKSVFSFGFTPDTHPSIYLSHIQNHPQPHPTEITPPSLDKNHLLLCCCSLELELWLDSTSTYRASDCQQTSTMFSFKLNSYNIFYATSTRPHPTFPQKQHQPKKKKQNPFHDSPASGTHSHSQDCTTYIVVTFDFVLMPITNAAAFTTAAAQDQAINIIITTTNTSLKVLFWPESVTGTPYMSVISVCQSINKQSCFGG